MYFSSKSFCLLFQCNLVPTDEITVYYNAKSEGRYLSNVIESHTDFIYATIKAPLKPYPVPTSDNILIQEQTQVSGVEILMFHTGFCFRFQPLSHFFSCHGI